MENPSESVFSYMAKTLAGQSGSLWKKRRVYASESITAEQLAELRDAGLSYTAIAKALKISKATVCKLMKQFEVAPGSRGRTPGAAKVGRQPGTHSWHTGDNK